MKVRPPIWLAFLAALTAPLSAEESNAWPFQVSHQAPQSLETSWQALGPLIFGKSGPNGRETSGVRPIFLKTLADGRESNVLLYPLFTWHREADNSTFSFFKLLNSRRTTERDGTLNRGFDLWPFYFSRSTGEPTTSYRALFPLGGTIKYRFGSDRLEWLMFPLYYRTEKAGKITTNAPWPFLRIIEGNGHHGFELWPLFGQRAKAGDYHHQFYLWPFFYKNSSRLSDPQPVVQIGALPFYTRESGPGYRSENFVWPFFGYTHRTAPVKYDEQRYLWPFLVQGRGPNRTVNRWAPIYTHSVVKGTAKTWFMWPLIRDERWQADGLAQEKFQFLYFLYWSHTQRSLTNPAAATASKTHFWPLLSAWNNGAGHRQLQILSPFEVFFQHDMPVRTLYTPLFALYRYEQRGPAETHWSLLWNAVAWHRESERREFHFGPLLSVRRQAESGRIALGAGLLGWRRDPGATRWRFFLFDFSRRSAIKTQPTP